MTGQNNGQRNPSRLPPRRIFTPGNRFDFDETKIPAGMRYGWKRVTLAGQEDIENQILAEQNGWAPVPAERHPELAGLRAEKGSAIIRGGQMLMELPAEYYDESVRLDQFAARHNVESQIQRLGLEARQVGARGIRRTSERIEGELVE